MPTLKFTIKGVEFEYIGEEDEIVSFINRFLGESMMPHVQAKPVSPATSPSAIVSTETRKMIDIPAPKDEDVIAYITSKPDFSHDLFEVQKHFFGRTFKSRGTSKRMYHRTARQLRLIRRTIEEQHKGRFIETKGSERGLKRFVFKKTEPHIGYT